MPTTPEQLEEEIAAGLLRFTVGGAERAVPELKWRANRAWQARMQAVFASLLDVRADTAEGMAAMADAQRGLVAEYDATGSLGDLEDATERELDAIYNRLVEVSFPLAGSREAAMLIIVKPLVLAAKAAASAPASSTSGPSPAGASGPTPSRRRSPSARSGSSTTARRSASRASGGSA